MLQLTPAQRVDSLLPRILEKYRDWKGIISTKRVTLERDLRPFGLWKKRSTSLKSLARKMEKLDGLLPSARKDLQALPSIGPYVASAVLSQYFGEPEPMIDSNMARVLRRYWGLAPDKDIRCDKTLQALARTMVTSPQFQDLNFAMLDLAAIVCLPRPRCASCLMRIRCEYYRSGRGEASMPTRPASGLMRQRTRSPRESPPGPS